MTNKMQLHRIIYYSLVALHVLSNLFAHHQEHLNCITASGITHICRCRLASWGVLELQFQHNTVQMLLMMNENVARNMQSSQEIINYPTQLHLVCHFRILYYDARKHEYQTDCNVALITPRHENGGSMSLYNAANIQAHTASHLRRLQYSVQ